MAVKSITSTEFRARAGQYLDEAAKSPVIITKHNRPSRVLLDIDEYRRMKRYDTREHLPPADLADAELRALEVSEMDPRHDHLNKLLD